MGNRKSKHSDNTSDQSLFHTDTFIEKYNHKFSDKRESTLTGEKLAVWLTEYLKTEEFDDINALRLDLNDPTHSNLKFRMDEDFQDELNEDSVHTIFTFLKKDIFSEETAMEDSIVINNDLLIDGNTANDLADLFDENIFLGTEDSKYAESSTTSSIQHPLDVFARNQAFISLKRLKTRTDSDDDGDNAKADEYTENKEPFPEFINVALFGRSDDEFLERLIDKAVLKLCYGDKFDALWSDKEFVTKIYDESTFPEAVHNIFNKANDNDDGLDFIGAFVNEQFKRQILEHKRYNEERAKSKKKIETSSNDDEKYNDYNVYCVDLDGEEYRIHRENTNHSSHAVHLFDLRMNDSNNDEFCWALWKRKKINNTYIKSRGYWKIVEDKEMHQKYENDMKLQEENKMKTQKTARDLFTNIIGYISPILTPRSPDNNKNDLNIVGHEEQLNLKDNVERKEEEKSVSKTGKKSKEIPLFHLHIIFELLQWHYMESVKDTNEKQQIREKNTQLAEAPLYRDFCFYIKGVTKSAEYRIRIDDAPYRLIWWNNKGRSDCNAFSISIGEEKRQYFYLRFKHRVKQMRWDWYDNDNAEYKTYDEGLDNCVYKELEATFQSNIESNFPPRVLVDQTQKSKAFDERAHPFDVCILPELAKNLTAILPRKFQGAIMLLRFTFTDTKNRIVNIEQLSMKKGNEPFPRNVRRLVNQQNTLQTYWQKTDEFIDEWKKRYLLLSKQQQLYFWSYILCICAIMKYIECEFQHQQISLPYHTIKSDGKHRFKGLDDSDLKRHKIDYQLWKGFFVPPTKEIHTASISKNMDSQIKDLKNWHESLSRVESLTKLVYYEDEADKIRSRTLNCIECKRKFKTGDILWLSEKTYDVYCGKCAALLKFSECIRKYVLETESQEVIDFLWPWYRNYFHRGDSTKYHRYIAKYNLSRLFVIQDVLPDYYRSPEDAQEVQKKEDYNEIKEFLKRIDMMKYYTNIKDYNIDDLDEMKQFNEQDLEHKLDIDNALHRNEILDELQKLKKEDKQIRHLRKFAASFLLGPFDILRNLNIIRNQLQSLFKYIADDNTLSEDQEFMSYAVIKAFNKTTSDKDIISGFKANYKRFKIMNDKEHKEEKESKEESIHSDNDEKTWDEWKTIINKNNGSSRKQLEHAHSNREQLLQLTTSFDLKDHQKKIVSSLFSSILKIEKEKNKAKHNTTKDKDYDLRRYYREFENSWLKTPHWWSTEHDLLLLELSLKYNWNRDRINEELTDTSKKLYYQQLLKTNPEDNEETINEIIGTIRRMDWDKWKLEQYIDKEDIIDWFETNKIGYIKFNKMEKKTFIAQITDNINVKKVGATKLYIAINKYSKEEEKEEEDIPEILQLDDKQIDFEYRGYQEFQVWCNDWRNIQHRLRYLTFVICKYLNTCRPSVIEIRIPKINDRIPHFDINSFVFLNGYIKYVHLQNCEEEKTQLTDIIDKSKTISEIAGKRDENNRQIYTHWRLQKVHESGVIDFNEKRFRRQIFNRDPFMTRDLDFELEQICQSFDLLEYGVEMGIFLIKLLTRKQVKSLWSALGIVLEYMPYEKARFVLNEKREDLRHGEPQQLKHVCDRIRRGSNFSVHICLFLAEYMENNAQQDLARFDEWMKFSKYYEAEARKSINEIESDHLLSVLMDIPLSQSGKQKVPLLQVALEQNRAQFLNNERINAVLKHVWQTPSGLDPTVSIQRKPFTSFEILKLLMDQPYHFYMTPMGFNSTTKTLHLLYVLIVFIFMSQRIYLDDDLGIGEWFVWTLNLGYFVYELIEAYDKGLRDYFTLAGWINYWDLQISFTWIILFSIRMVSIAPKREYADYLGKHETSDNDYEWNWIIAQSYMVLWALQAASLSARSLVLFQTSTYFGLLITMIQRLVVEMMRFMFVLALLLFGFVFGLYYIQGGYDVDHIISAWDWYSGFRYLFQLTVGAGDFSEIEYLVEDQITAQIYTILYIILATILMMNLLIALMTTTFENVYSQARTESSFAIAEATYDLSHRSRFMPAPICIYVIVFAAIVHNLNFIPALFCPKTCNIYNCINHYQYEGLVKWRFSVNSCFKICNRNSNTDIAQQRCCLCCKQKNPAKRKCGCCTCCNNEESDIDLKVNERVYKDVYKLTTTGRVWKYYASTFCCSERMTPRCIEKRLSKHRFEIHHIGCYSCIPTELGAKDTDKDRSTCHGITLNEYAEIYEDHFKFSLDPQDTVLLKHLTVDTLFCKYCYRPFDPKNKYNLKDVLLTPFWALSEIISIYVFPLTVWFPLIIAYILLSILEWIGDCMKDTESEAPNVPDYDRQYFPKETLHSQS